MKNREKLQVNKDFEQTYFSIMEPRQVEKNKWSKSSIGFLFVVIIIVIILSCVASYVSAASPEIDDYEHVGGTSSTILSNLKSRQKRFILHFRMKDESKPVGHFRISMMPPFLTSMMKNIPSMIRRNFLFGNAASNQPQDQSVTY